jgi:hypothetical protein
VRNALDRARLRQANRLFAAALDGAQPADPAALTLITAGDIRASRVFDRLTPGPHRATPPTPAEHTAS